MKRTYLQDLYKKSPISAATYVLDGKERHRPAHTLAEMLEVWRPLLEDEGPTMRDVENEPYELQEIWTPVTPKEYLSNFPDRNTSAGPDLVSISLWRMVPAVVGLCLFNVMILS
jgi:hypothetical protein